MASVATAAERALLLRIFWDLQPYSAPQPLDAFEVHAKVLLLELPCDPPVTKPRTLPRQLQEALPQGGLVTADSCPVTHAAA